MININDIAEKFALPKFDMPKFDMPKFDMPKFDMPTIDLTNFDLSKVELPKVELPNVDVTRAADFMRDAAYVSLGAMVVTAKAMDERRRAATEYIAGFVGATA